MKSILVSLFAVGLLAGCQPSPSESKPEHKDSTVEHKHITEEKRSTLELNQGAKWKADASTKANVGKLKNTIAGAEQKGLENYGKVATALQEDINQLVSQCKMTGPDHEALHHWLEPIIENVKALSEVSSSEKAGSLLTDIRKQVDLFDEYFE